MPKKVREKLAPNAVKTITDPGYHLDGLGLYLQVTKSGAKSWVFCYMRAGKSREMGLGSADAVSLSKAREKAASCRELLAEDIDPIEARDAARTASKLAASRHKTFKDCATTYIKVHKAGWKNAKHGAQWTSTLETYAYPIIGSLSVAAIDTQQVMDILEPIWNEKTETASRVRGRIEKVLDWATVKKYRVGLNPARWKGHLDKVFPKRSKVAKVKHHAALPFDEIAAFLTALRALDGIAPRALEFVILTAARTSEAIGAKWDEIDFHNRAWNVPAERMKAGKPHRVPLSDAAIAVLRGMEKIKLNEYVFPGQKVGEPLSNMACLAVLDRMERDDLTVHGFRSSFRDWAAERTSFPNFVAEMALAHIVKGVEGDYRRGDLFEKRRKLMDAWAAHCARTESASVTPIRKKTAAGR